MKKKSAFTIVELLIVIALISLLVIATFVLINPVMQINKSKYGISNSESRIQTNDDRTK